MLVAHLLAVYAGAFLCALLTWEVVRRVRRAPLPPFHQRVRIRGPRGVYRSRFEGQTVRGWMFSAPLQRGSHVPLRVGDLVVVECPYPNGVALYRAPVLERMRDPHMVVLAAPRELRVRDRRLSRRSTKLAGVSVRMNGHDARIVNLSAGGVRLRTRAQGLAVGDRVKVDLPGRSGEAWGFVLACETVFELGQSEQDVRVVFEGAISRAKR